MHPDGNSIGIDMDGIASVKDHNSTSFDTFLLHFVKRLVDENSGIE